MHDVRKPHDDGVIECKALAAPFQILLRKRHDDGEVVDADNVPDHFGLSGAVLYSRVLHSEHLGGREIRFIRKLLRLKQGRVAEALGLQQETLSRVENCATVIGPSSEKLFRIFAIRAANAFFSVDEPVGRTVMDECLSLVFRDHATTTSYDDDRRLSLNFQRRAGLWRRIVDENYRTRS